MKKYQKILKWIGGIALVLGFLGATEAMAQPAPAPIHHGNSWLVKPLKKSSMIKAIPKDKVKAHHMKAGRPYPEAQIEHPIPPHPPLPPKKADHQFDKKQKQHHGKPMIHDEKGPKDAQHKVHPGKRPDQRIMNPGSKMHKR